MNALITSANTTLDNTLVQSLDDAGVPLREVQLAARHADPRTTTVYDRRRTNFDEHAAHVDGTAMIGPSATFLRTRRVRDRPGRLGFDS
jgi:hypothetical protein